MSESHDPHVVSIANAAHYTWGDGCDGWHLVRAPGLSVIQERMPAGASEARHLHRESRQFFFVLRGTLSIELNGTLHDLEPTTSLEVPPGTPHAVHNRGPEIADFLVISQPPSHSDRHAPSSAFDAP